VCGRPVEHAKLKGTAVRSEKYRPRPRRLGRRFGLEGVYADLVRDGFNVSIVQEPETSFEEDVAATKRVLAQQDGPCVLVAQSYGGAIITEAGMDPSVAGLVYVAAHMPDAGENEADDGKRFPSDLSKSGAIKKTADGFTYLDPTQFHEYFAADRRKPPALRIGNQVSSPLESRQLETE
jgi:pimeloyl-ACP methyl ester carboxylesterase